MTALGTTDPLWAVQGKERSRYEEMFKSLHPQNGVVTGEQAKGFFLQSQLPPNLLGQIWALSDTDSDGRMNINEFSIACKLINLTLRGFQIPSVLPPALRNLETQFPSVNSLGKHAIPHTVTPLKSQNVQEFVSSQPSSGVVSPVASVLPVDSMTNTVPSAFSQSVAGNAIPTQLTGGSNNVSSLISQSMPTSQSLSYPTSTSVIAPTIVQELNLVSQGASVIPQVQPLPQTIPGIPQPIPPVPTPPTPGASHVAALAQSSLSLEAGKTIEKGQPTDFVPPSMGSQSTEWAVPHHSKLKYTQLFNTTDRARTGFLTGSQAKPILIQTKLPQGILAQIWALADSDSNGKINCEEFVLTMHLCDMAKEGKPVPATLPYELVPPSMRRKRGNSLSLADDKQDVMAVQNSVTFEDKRKENFDKGQAELERRRALLLEAQRKEQEEREKKEREEQEKREALRAEQELKRQQELQRQLQKQRELELEQEEQRRRASEQREAARKELERQRQQEWEKTRSQELEAQRMKEQNNVLKLKAKNQSLAIELATLGGKVKELSVKISETRTGVSSVKATIDGMRATRDSHMSDMSTFKNKLKEQNQRLLLLAQEKARLESKGKLGTASSAAASEQIMLAFTNKQITIKHLNEKLADLQSEVKAKTEDVKNNNTLLKDLKTQLINLVNECESIYANYSEKRDAILQLKAVSGNSNWGVQSDWESAADSWSGFPQNTVSWNSSLAAPTSVTGYKKYRALYKFQSRNPDELSFQPGDIITVPPNQSADPGWLSGELQGVSGWFPEAYVELIDETSNNAIEVNETLIQEKQPLEGILELPEGGSDKTNVDNDKTELYISVYRYESTEAGDLNFEQGETILVTKKDGAWWTGTIGERSGLFPSNYVEKIETKNDIVCSAALNDDANANENDSVFTNPNADESTKREITKSPLPSSAATNGQESDFKQAKPVTPDFSAITAAQTKMGKKGEVATVIAPYQATSAEQLSLARGQLVCIRKKTTTGWWEGELQAKGKKKQIGWFPASYVKVMASRRLSQTTPDVEAEQNFEKVIAMFPYKALNEDELSFEKDDVISILAKDEATWWKGELKGAIGLFPCNYVMPLDNQSQRFGWEERLRQEAIHELIESERSYTADMALVRQVFEKPMSKSGLVTQDQLQKIFLNWREILKGNHALLRLLDERKKQSSNGFIDCIGDILCDNLPRMGAYVRFCSCQLSAGALLQQLTDSSSAFREFCKQCQRDSRTQGLPLSTFLVKPMQRITKYPLLIEKVLRHTLINHPDRPYLEEALLRAEKLCSQVNEGVRENENSERLEWLQRHIILDGLEESLIFNSVTNCLGRRKFLYYGVLTKIRSGRELIGFLLSDFLILTYSMKPLENGYFSMEKFSSDLKMYKKPFLVKEMTVQKSSDSDRAFTIYTPNSQLAFFSGTSGERSQWIKYITQAREKYKSPESVPHSLRFFNSEDGGSAGRLLVEVVEGYNLEFKSCLCQVRLNNQVQYTPPSGPSFKWNSAMQFFVQDLKNDILLVALLVKYDFKPDDFLDRGEIQVNEILEQTRSGGPVLRKLVLPQLRTAEILLKLDLVLFSVS